MTKHLVDIDDHALSAARAELGTASIKDTVNESLRRTISGRKERVSAAMDVLAAAPATERLDPWR